MGQEIRVDLDPKRVELSPGATATVRVSLRNTSDVVQHLLLEMVGLPNGSSSTSDPDVFKLMPGATAAATMSFTLAEQPPAPAGRCILGVLARSPHSAGTSRCEELELNVDPVPAMSARVEPSLVTAGARAVFTAHVVNEGNTRLPLQLTGSDAEQQVRMAFAPPTLDLRPGQAASVTVTAQAAVPWTGPDRRRSLTVRATGPEVAADAAMTFVQEPRLASGLLRAVGAAVAVLVLATAVLGASWLSGRSDDDAEGDVVGQAEATTAPTATEAPSVAPSTAEPSASSTETTSPTPSADPSPGQTPASQPPTPTAPPAPTTRTVEVTALPGGPGARPVEGGAFSAAGVLLAGIADGGSSTCADATRVAAHGSGAATFVTAATPSDLTSCQASPLLLAFPDEDAPVTRLDVTVQQVGTYTVRTEVTDAEAVPPSSVAVGADLLLSVSAPAGGRLTAVTIGRPPAASEPAVVGIRQLVLTGPAA